MWQKSLLIITAFTLVLVGCAEGDTAGKETEYESIKKAVVDILQTEDGKKAIQEVILDEEMKKELVIHSDIVKSSLTEKLHSEDGTKMWSNLFEDPSFVEGFVKSTEESQKKLIKSLMHDAGFQKQMIELLQNPEMMKQILTVLKGQQFREHLEETIQESLNSPLFLAKIEKTLLKAVEKEKQKEEEKKSGEGGEQDSEKGSEDGGEEEGNM